MPRTRSRTAFRAPAPHRVWFLVPPRTGLLNIAGPWEVLGHANDILGRGAYQLDLFGPAAEVRTRHGLLLGGLRPLPRGGTRLPDTVVVAGAPRNPLPGEQTALAAWLRRFHRRIPRVVSICTGAFLLGAAGALDGRRATTHWLLLDELRRLVPRAEVVDEGIYVRDGNVWTSAGITAGIDLALALVEEDHGHRVAREVAKRLVLFLRRSGNQAQFSSAPGRPGGEDGDGDADADEPAPLPKLLAFVREHLDAPLPVERLAAGVGMSPRTLSRWCREHLRESPAALVRRLRVEEARRLLAETSLPLKDITARIGLGDPSTLWRVFTRRLGVTPAEYRQRFARAA